MLCYTGIRFARLYLNRKSKNEAWSAFMKNQYYICEFSDLRRAYIELFEAWDDESKWEEATAFFDENY